MTELSRGRFLGALAVAPFALPAAFSEDSSRSHLYGSRLKLTPSTARMSDTIRLAGLGFKPNRTGRLFLDGSEVGTFHAQKDGYIDARLVVPPGTIAGHHAVEAVDSGTAASAHLRVLRSVYLGVSLAGMPGHFSEVRAFEAAARKKMAMVNWSHAMGGRGAVIYPRDYHRSFAAHLTPVVTWEPRNWDSGAHQGQYTLTNIAAGSCDRITRYFARTYRSFRKPIFLRWAWEMNGSWYPWGKQPAEFVAAWRRLHSIFMAEGATNVKWIWCPNTMWNAESDFSPYFPGDKYVDYLGLDSYNSQQNGRWLTFDELFGYSYEVICNLSYRPLIICETASDEASGFRLKPAGASKARWIEETFRVSIPAMSRIVGVNWFNVRTHKGNYLIQSSSKAHHAFVHGIAPPTYLTSVEF